MFYLLSPTATIRSPGSGSDSFGNHEVVEEPEVGLASQCLRIDIGFRWFLQRIIQFCGRLNTLSRPAGSAGVWRVPKICCFSSFLNEVL